MAEHTPFQRNVSDKLLVKLQSEQLFEQRLKPDVFSGQVFPAVRKGRVDFYHWGGKLFSYDERGFRTHLKYASCFEAGQISGTEIRDDQLASLRPIRSFLSGYDQIKAICKVYAQRREESYGVSELSRRFGCIASPVDADVVVLDVEASFDSTVRDLDDEDQQDRIDLVLLHRREEGLLFVEAKLVSNPQVRSSQGAPEVVAQVSRYQLQLEKQNAEILVAYENHVATINRLFGRSLPKSTATLRAVPLLVFRFDADQREGRLKEHFRRLSEDFGICCLRIGDLKTATPATLSNWYRSAASWPRPSVG
jgi:hypothetical protein